MEHVERQVFGGFPIADDPRDPREDDAVRLRVHRIQRTLIACCSVSYRGEDVPKPSIVICAESWRERAMLYSCAACEADTAACASDENQDQPYAHQDG